MQVIATETLQQNARSGFTEVIINVVNENDNNPSFVQDIYTSDMPENNAAGFVVEVSYSLVDSHCTT